MSGLSLPQTRVSKIVDPMIARIGLAASWLWVVLLVVIISNVILRYAFGEGRIEFEELQWHLYSAAFLFGIGYTLMRDSHIRVDVIHERMRPRLQAWIELYGLLLCVLPFIALVLVFSVRFVSVSYEIAEVSASPGGLPYRWLIKAMLPAAFVVLLLAAMSRLTRVWAYLFGNKS